MRIGRARARRDPSNDALAGGRARLWTPRDEGRVRGPTLAQAAPATPHPKTLLRTHMYNRTSRSFRLLAPVVALGLAACTAGTDGSSIAAPSSPLRVLTTASVGDAGDRAPQQGELEICKDGDAASFPITGLAADPVIVNLTDGQCQVVAVDKRSGLDTLRLTVTELPSLTSTFTSV